MNLWFYFRQKKSVQSRKLLIQSFFSWYLQNWKVNFENFKNNTQYLPSSFFGTKYSFSQLSDSETVCMFARHHLLVLLLNAASQKLYSQKLYFQCSLFVMKLNYEESRIHFVYRKLNMYFSRIQPKLDFIFRMNTLQNKNFIFDVLEKSIQLLPIVIKFWIVKNQVMFDPQKRA